MAARPNILCIVSEDCPPHLLGFYGNALARTPNLDRLAGTAVIYENANCTSPVCAPSRFAILTGRHAESVPRAQHMQALAHLPDSAHTYPAEMRKAGYYCTNNVKTHYNCDVDPDEIWDASSRTAHWRDRADGQPFLAVFNCMTTHESATFQDQPGAVRPEDVSLPGYLPDTPGMRQSLARHYNAVARMDAELGRHLNDLDTDGLAEDTIVFYFSDHGSALPRSKRYLYDEGLRVPLVIRVPSRWQHLMPHAPGTRVSEPVSLVDLFPSFLAIAGAEVPSGLHGHSLMGEAVEPRQYAFSGRDRMGERYDLSRSARSRRYRYIRNYTPYRPLGQHVAYEWLGAHYQDYEAAHLAGKLDRRQERFWQSKPFEEFYDLEADPDATENLAGNAAHAAALEAHSVALDAHMRAIRDTGFIPEHSAVETWDKSQDDQAYPFEAVLALAAMAGRGAPEDGAAFVAALDHVSPVMRHWAARGLLNLAATGAGLPDGVEVAFVRESDPLVSIPLAEALGRSGDDRRWVRVLTNILTDQPDPRIKLYALDALTWLPLHADISLKAAEALHDDPDTYLRQASDYLAARLAGTYKPTDVIFNLDRLDPEGQHGKQKASTSLPA